MTILTLKSLRAAAIVVIATLLSCHRGTYEASRLRADGAFVFGEIGSSEHGQQLQGARVDLLTTDRATRDSAITDVQGRFLIGPVAPGSYDLLVRRIAHQRTFLKVTLNAAATDTVRIVLKYDTSGVISDCIGPDGWSFGSQYCKR